MDSLTHRAKLAASNLQAERCGGNGGSQITRGTCFALALACVSACDGGLGVEGPSWLEASVLQSDSVAVFEGTGYFNTYLDPPKREDTRFHVHADGVVGTLGASFSFLKAGPGDRPPVGEYELGRIRWSDGAMRGFEVLFDRTGSDGMLQQFVIRSGRLRITRSTSQRVEGTFELVADLYCQQEPDDDYWFIQCAPSILVEGGPSVEVRGSFSLHPWQVYRPGVVID